LFIVGISGPTGSGKTKMLEEIVRTLCEKDFRVGVVKCTNLEKFDVKGKDTQRLRAHGAEFAVGLASSESVVFMERKEFWNIIDLIPTVDILLVEGCSEVKIPRIGKEIKWDGNIENFLIQIRKFPQRSMVSLYVNGSKIPLNRFTSNLLRNLLTSFASTLKGVDKVKNMEIKIVLDTSNGELQT